VDPQRHWSQRIAIPVLLWTSAWLFVCSVASLATEYWWCLPLLPLALCLLTLSVLGRPARLAKPMAMIWPIASIGFVSWQLFDVPAEWFGALVASVVFFVPGCVGFWLAARHHAQWLLDDAIDVRENVCENCGYSIRGLRSPRCPECGHDIRLSP